MKDKVEIKVVGGVNEDFKSCDDCKYTRLPISAYRVMGCIHSWNSMKDFYEKDKKYEDCGAKTAESEGEE